MANRTFRCTLITPESKVFEEDATSVVIPLHDGLTGVLPLRAPFVATLGLGEFRITFAEGGSHSYYLEDGFAQMVGDKLTLLAQTAIPVEQISQSETEAELAEANARTGQTATELDRINKERSRARAKLSVVQRFQDEGGGI